MPLVPLLVGVVFLLAGLGAFGYLGISVSRQHNRLSHAIEVDGTIESDSIEVNRVSGGDTDTKYEVDLQYGYEVNGDSYRASTLYPGNDKLPSRERAAAVAAEYSPGQQVTTYVLEDDPDTAYLRPQWRYRGLIILFVGGTGLVAVGLFMLATQLGLGPL